MRTYHLNNTVEPEIHLNPKLIRMPWGKHRNEPVYTLPDDYLMLLEDGFNTVRRGKVCSQNYKVPAYLMDCARQVLQNRGYKKKGERWER
jgi:uncharacterized protein (DUF3820 family)